ncbi:hypothetical protein Q4488_02305 [Amphritea sp. 1_MG-2023]|uniref:hypothetical protein n=1 Tax=Amphritea sp. 1_MG-2023 TaxID=3062670 RepID=UPI0026E25E0F|nr:hypothetical protein [Amphritea sp. 1_MG-2023]MDO6562204.1 hypothetical protein [Amphritea sp. 1_MG-2023]
MTSEKSNKANDHERPLIEKRCGIDRRNHKNRREQIRYEPDRRKNHGRRVNDKDPWKDAFEFD